MRILLFIYFIFYSFCGYTQQSDTIQLVDNYYKEAKKIIKTNQDKALSVAQMGIDLSLDINHQAGLGEGYALKADILVYLGDFQLSKIHYLESLKIRKRLRDSCQIGDIFKNLSYVYTQIGEQGQALIYIDSAILVLEKSCIQPKFIGRGYIQQGNIFLELGRLNEAESFFLKGQTVLKDIDPEGYTIARENIGIV